MSELSIIMLGTGSPRPDLERSSSAQVLLIDDLPVLIDCGEGATRQLMQAGIGLDKVTHLWLTHLHSDHVLGYGQFLLGGWANGRRQLTVAGPVGTKVLHETFLKLFEKDIEYRTSLGRSPKGLLDVEIIEVEEPGRVLSDLPAKVTAQRMIHNVPTFAYRFQVGEKAVVFSGDTAPTQTLVDLAFGADALVHDAGLAANATYNLNPTPENQRIWTELQKEHCSPAEAAETAQKAGVKQLVLTHFSPNIDEARAYKEASENFSGEVIVAKDLQVISV